MTVEDDRQKVLIKNFPDIKTQAKALADEAACLLSEAVSKRGQASLVVSGGSTPVRFFEELSGRKIEWPRITVTLADERMVPEGHPDSNGALVKKHLLKDRAAKARFIGLYAGAEAAGGDRGERYCEERVRSVGLPFDVLILGMGSDGHTASLFPGAPELKGAVEMDSGRLCASITPPDAPHARITLTLPALLSSRRIFLLISGKEKMEVLRKALEAGSPEEMPIRYVLNGADRPVEVFWAPR
jgi:6-phosphogluconolactonase